ncbi:MAG: hypothetical protein ACHBN1_16945 [Heteroscytonema crispum UTEX LB 1556]
MRRNRQGGRLGGRLEDDLGDDLEDGCGATGVGRRVSRQGKIPRLITHNS